MKIFGYATDGKSTLFELSELSLQADAHEIRQLARFLEHCANGIESDDNQDGWDHEHIIDFSDNHVGPDVIVVRSEQTLAE